MANSRFEYVKSYELDDRLLPGCWIVIRLDGKGFTKFSKEHGFEKPNDLQALMLMNRCATEVLTTFGDVKLAFGQSDEYSFIIHKDSTLYGRRASKLVSLIVSCFSASYVIHWPQFFPGTSLKSVPCFDGRAICYPSMRALRDYLSWRQSDTHINNQYNTCYWALVDSGMTPAEAQATLKGTLSDAKNELMFSRFNINYNNLPAQFRKGSIVYRSSAKVEVKTRADGSPVFRERCSPVVEHVDIIGDGFWQQHPELLP